VEGVDGNPAPGDTVEVVDAAGQWLALAAYSPTSRIACRVWTFDPQETIDDEAVRRRLEASLFRRRSLATDSRVTAYREVHAESDLLPGVIVDRYGEIRVLQLLTPGADRFRETLLDALRSRGDCRGIFERSDGDARDLEGLEPRRGVAWGEARYPELRRRIRLAFW
jgi:23S rRNA (cytosine1962-C5)-methyltransferase